MQLKQFNISKGQFAAVGIKGGQEYTLDSDGVILLCLADNTAIPLPPGRWQILFRRSEATEELAGKVVEEVPTGFADYKLDLHTDIMEAFFACNTALESLDTLMASKEMFLKNPHEKPNPFEYGMLDAEIYAKDLEKYNAAQPHVFADFVFLIDTEG